jgi:hypothetical protein
MESPHSFECGIKSSAGELPAVFYFSFNFSCFIFVSQENLQTLESWADRANEKSPLFKNTIDVERGFSAMKRLKSPDRNRLGEDVLNMLMRVGEYFPKGLSAEAVQAIAEKYSSSPHCNPSFLSGFKRKVDDTYRPKKQKTKTTGGVFEVFENEEQEKDDQRRKKKEK